jgi:hypothetical protein
MIQPIPAVAAPVQARFPVQVQVQALAPTPLMASSSTTMSAQSETCASARKRCHKVCAVSQCHPDEDAGVLWHNFPKEAHVAKKWVDACRRKDKVNPATAVICSLHFANDSYKRDLFGELTGRAKRKRLIKGAVPTLYVSLEDQAKLAEEQAQAKRRKILSKPEDIPDTDIFAALAFGSPLSLTSCSPPGSPLSGTTDSAPETLEQEEEEDTLVSNDRYLINTLHPLYQINYQ